MSAVRSRTKYFTWALTAQAQLPEAHLQIAQDRGEAITLRGVGGESSAMRGIESSSGKRPGGGIMSFQQRSKVPCSEAVPECSVEAMIKGDGL